jgi:hypothetical protein
VTMRHGRPISPAVYDVLYGEWRLRVGWRREHAHRVWQAMQCQLLLVGAYSWGLADGEDDVKDELRWVRPKSDSNATGGGNE